MAATLALSCAGFPLGSEAQTQVPRPPATCDERAPSTLEDQTSCGRVLYDTQCGSCHQEGLELAQGDRGPELDAMRLFSYTTPENIVYYALNSMPPEDPGVLSDQAYWNVVTFLVRKAGLYRGTDVLSSKNGTVRLIKP